MKRTARLLWIMLAVWMVACQSAASPAVSESQRPPAESSSAALSPSPSATALLAAASPGCTVTPVMIAPPEATEAPFVAAPTLADDPLRFVFPTQGPEPILAWRPPLYPVPWAPTPFDHFYFLRPVSADTRDEPNADYRYGGVFFENVVHTGVDILVPIGTPVLAAGPGRVVWVGYGLYRGVKGDETDPYGLAVAIRHDFGWQGEPLYTVYAHLSGIDVAPGQHVETGQTIALSGNTGKTTGPHLHFEVRLGKNDYFSTLNPELWISPPQGWGLLVGRMENSGGELLDDQPLFLTNPQGQIWIAQPYGKEAAKSDPFYQENLVLADLPAGVYTLATDYAGFAVRSEVQIFPGMVTYFTFKGRQKFDLENPLLPGQFDAPKPFAP